MEKISSYQTIYRAIYDGLFNKKGLSHGDKGAIRKLRQRGKVRRISENIECRGKIRISNSIEQRSQDVDKCVRIGDCKADRKKKCN